MRLSLNYWVGTHDTVIAAVIVVHVLAASLHLRSWVLSAMLGTESTATASPSQR